MLPPFFFTSLGYKNPGVDIIPASSIAKLLLLVVPPKSRDFSRSWEKTPLQEKWTVTARNRARTGRVMSPFGRKLSPFGRATSPLPNWSSYWQRNPSKPQKSRWCPKHGFWKKGRKKGTTSEDAGIKEIQREYRNVKYVKWWEPEEEYKNLR